MHDAVAVPDRIVPMSFGLSPWAICEVSESMKCAWPPSWVMPASNELRVRVDLSKKIRNAFCAEGARSARRS